METSTGEAYINKVHEEQGIFIRWTVLLEQNLEAFSLDGLYIWNKIWNEVEHLAISTAHE